MSPTSKVFQVPIPSVNPRPGSAKPAAQVSRIPPASYVPIKAGYSKKPTWANGFTWSAHSTFPA